MLARHLLRHVALVAALAMTIGSAALRSTRPGIPTGRDNGGGRVGSASNGIRPSRPVSDRKRR